MYILCFALYNECISMAFLSSSERAFLRAASRLAFCNPFLPERVEHERAALGAEFADDEPVWSFSVNMNRAGAARMCGESEARLDELCPRLRGKLAARVAATEEDRVLYEDGVLNLLYQRYYLRFFEAGFGEQKSGRRVAVALLYSVSGGLAPLLRDRRPLASLVL
jgi:hypothetical protein